MKTSKSLIWLCVLVSLLALVAAAVGLFWKDGGSRFTFTTLHGQEVQMYGEGLYRNDTIFTAGTFIGTDAVTILACIPFLIAALLLYRRGSLRGGYLLIGALSFFLYNSASLAFGAAYNSFFLVYISLFAASLFAFILAFTCINYDALPSRISAGMPHRGLSAFFLVTGVALLFIWLSDVVIALVEGHAPPLLASYTTMVTYVLDIGVIVPALLVTQHLIRRRSPVGYPLACTLLILCTIIGVVVTAQTTVQISMDIVLPPAQFAVMVGSFILMGLFAIWLLVLLLRNTTDRPALS
jgi:hypothetical protein